MKQLAAGLTIIFLALGIVLGIQTDTVQKTYTESSGVVALRDGQYIAQRLQGNDYCIKEAVFYIDSGSSLSDDSEFHVYLTRGEYDLDNDETEIISQVSIKAAGTDGRLTVSFPGKKLVYHRDYYLVFAYADPSGDGVLQLKSNDRQGGLFGDGVTDSQSLACDITYETHATKVFFVWKILFLFGFCSISVCLRFGTDYLEAIGVTCLGTAIWLYLCGLLNLLKPGICVLFACAVACTAYWLYTVYKSTSKQIAEIIRERLGAGLLCWGIVLALYLVLDFSRSLYGLDDFIQWAHSVQLMYLFDKIPVHAKSTLMNFRYPPLFSLFQYLFMKVYGKSATELMYFGKHFFDTALLLGCVPKIKKYRVLSIPAAVFLCIGLQDVFFDGYQVHNLYVDITLAVLWGYMLLKIYQFSRKKTMYNAVVLAMSVLVLTLTKEVGLVLVLITIVALFCVWFYRRRLEPARFWLVLIGMILGTAFAGEISWQVWLKQAVKSAAKASVVRAPTQASTVAASGYALEPIINYLTGNGKPYQYEIIPRHVKKLLFEREFINPYFPLSYFGWIALLCVIVWLVAWVRPRYKKEGHSAVIFIAAAGILEAVFMHLSYTFTFGEAVAVVFESERRYLGTAIMGLALLTMLSLWRILCEKYRGQLVFMGVLCVFIYAMSNGFLNYKLKIMEPEEINYGAGIAEDTNRAMALKNSGLLGENDTICYASLEEAGMEFLYYQYYVIPTKLTDISGLLKNDDVTDSYAAEQMEQFDYFYIRNGSGRIAEKYGALFESREEIGDGQLYRIIPGEKMLLHKVVY